MGGQGGQDKGGRLRLVQLKCEHPVFTEHLLCACAGLPQALSPSTPSDTGACQVFHVKGSAGG